ncbi:MAG: hypothetical protein D6706_02060 [Chloroflexi bacterium]|nr:MAG: hypothetical protein D6706_02060 [Chloroflexota bacterium]
MREGHNLDLTIRVICPKSDRDLTNEVEYIETCSHNHAPEYWDILHVDDNTPAAVFVFVSLRVLGHGR